MLKRAKGGWKSGPVETSVKHRSVQKSVDEILSPAVMRTQREDVAGSSSLSLVLTFACIVQSSVILVP